MIGYIFATGNAWDSTTSYVSKLNMNTETNAGAATSMAATRNRATAMCRDFVYAYVHGGGNSSQMVRYNLSTEANNLSTTHPDGTQNNPAGGQGATVGWIRGGGARSYNFSTETFASWPDSPVQTELTKLFQVEMVSCTGILVEDTEPVVIGI